jgi:hypothetical protein
MAECVFCGVDETLSKEDVIPLWTRPFLAASQTGGHGDRINHSYESPDERAARSHTRNARNPDVKVAAVCKERCNNGWMSQLEARTKPLLGPMIRGRPTPLSVNDQQILATWAVKTTLMFHLARPASTQPGLGASTYRRFFSELRPPVGTKVLLGATHGGPAAWESTTRLTTSAGVGPALPAVLTALALGNVLLVTLLLDTDTAPTVGVLQARFAGPFSHIWPIDRELRWPCHPPIDGDEMTLDALGHLLSHPGSPHKL